MHLPYALYEISLTNMESLEVISAFAGKEKNGALSLFHLRAKAEITSELSILVRLISYKA